MRVVEKGWGHEVIWADEADYCGKNLVFKAGKRFSMHFHHKKDETWFIQTGKFKLLWIDTDDATTYVTTLYPGDTWRNPPLMPHQLICEEAGTVVEVSTYDDPADNYRVLPGDSQA
jgi:mannose-6-phosphate isomerase-like protein (cupin superfamily)